jgi:hypothetical protein
LAESDFKRIKIELGLCPPPDVKALLCEGVPVGDYFPNWHGDLATIFDRFIEPIIPHFLFHVEQGVFWPPGWGSRPKSSTDAVEVARSLLANVPKLFPMGDRLYLKAVPCTPILVGNPVFSVRGSDVLHAGRNVFEYLTWFSEPKESAVEDPTPVYSEDYRPIEFWSEVCRWNNSM